MKTFGLYLSLAAAGSILLFTSCKTLIPEQSSADIGILIVQVDTVSSVSPVYSPKLKLEFIDQTTGQMILETTSTTSDGLRSFPVVSGLHRLEVTPSVNTRNGGRVLGEASDAVLFSIPRGTVVILNSKLEFLMSGGSEVLCRWEDMTEDELSDIKAKVLSEENQINWNLAVWDLNLSEHEYFQ